MAASQRRNSNLRVPVSTKSSAVRLERNAPIWLIRELMMEYGLNLGHDLTFQNFEAELASLPGSYAEPDGCLLVAYAENEAAGCGAFRPLGEGCCEMKRLYVRGAFRGKNIGRILAQALMSQAKIAGYRAMRLDTLASMLPAVALYESVGFRRIPPYYNNPIEGVAYFEADLEA